MPVARPCVGLVLPGGGARNAYQAGVLAAIAEFWPAARNPFAIITGTSAGAINAAVLASGAQHFQATAARLEAFWSNIHSQQVFHTHALAVLGNVLRWLAGAIRGGTPRAAAILDTTPLRTLLQRHIALEGVQQALDNGALRALAVTCSGYESGLSKCYFQAAGTVSGWTRSRRVGIPAQIGLDHLLASAALPVLMPAVRIGDEYCGDGSMRETAPLSPALHLGAERLLVISVRENVAQAPALPPPAYPSIGQIGGYVLDTLFLDSIEADVERLRRINRTLAQLRHQGLPPEKPELRHVECLLLAPSVPLTSITARHMHHMPTSLRLLLRSLGAFNPGGAALASYLLFEAAHCRELIALGRRDALARREEILALLGSGP